eukprot:Platyproteum_vivax@DN16611_c0_g1_i1.p1
MLTSRRPPSKSNEKKKWQVELEKVDTEEEEVVVSAEELQRLRDEEKREVEEKEKLDRQKAEEKEKEDREVEKQKEDTEEKEDKSEEAKDGGKRKRFAWMDSSDEDDGGDEEDEDESEKVDDEEMSDIDMRFVHINNVSFDISLDDLKRYFEECGHVKSVRAEEEANNKSGFPPPLGRNNHKGRVWMEFNSCSAAKKAVSKSNNCLNGRVIKVINGWQQPDGTLTKLQTEAHWRYRTQVLKTGKKPVKIQKQHDWLR